MEVNHTTSRTSRLAWGALAISILSCPLIWYAGILAMRKLFDPGRDAEHILVWAGVTLMVFALIVALVALIRIAANPATLRGLWIAIVATALSILSWIGCAVVAIKM